MSRLEDVIVTEEYGTIEIYSQDDMAKKKEEEKDGRKMTNS